MSDRWTVLRLREIPPAASEERPTWYPIRTDLGIAAFGVNAWEATEPGQEVIAEHDEVEEQDHPATRHEELYLVWSGHATFTVAGEEIEAPAGTFVFVRDPAARRKAVAGEVGTTVLAMGGPRGEAFAPSGWEGGAEVLRYWTTGEWEKAIAALAERNAEVPGKASVLYNLACAESRGGRADDALGHLEEALALSPSLRSAARTDPDFRLIRDDPRFPPPD
jgi:tetratricopeptide (TPR) repeat protein